MAALVVLTLVGLLAAAESAVCNTAVCLRKVTMMKEWMDLSVDPCNDFAHYACGGFWKKTTVPSGRDRISVQDQFHDKLKTQLKETLSQPVVPGEPTSHTKVKNLYQSCTDTARLETLGYEPLKAILRSIGGWLLMDVESRLSENPAWEVVLNKLVRRGLYDDFIFRMDVGQDYANTLRRVFRVTYGHDFYDLDTDKVFMETVIKTLNASIPFNTTAPTVADDMKLIRTLEVHITQFFQVGDPPVNRTILGLMSIYSYLPWRRFFRTLPAKIRVSDDSRIVDQHPNFMDAMRTVLKFDPGRTISNYLVWEALHTRVLPHLHLEMRSIYFPDAADPEARALYCAKEVSKLMGAATASMYLQRFPTVGLTEANTVATNMRRAMGNAMRTVPWMDDATRISGQQKHQELILNVGSTDAMRNTAEIDKYYEPLMIDPGQWLQNTLDVHIFHRNENLNEYGTKKPRFQNLKVGELSDKPDVKYFRYDNVLAVPAALIQEPMFHAELPPAVVYASLGAKIGRELVGAYNKQGKDGNINNYFGEWWTRDTQENYRDASLCLKGLVEEEAALPHEDVSEVIREEDDIAVQWASAQVAYRAFQRVEADAGSIQMLLDIKLKNGSASSESELESRKLFWVSYAMNHCSKEAQDAEDLFKQTGKIPSKKFDINALVMNQKIFAQDFQCVRGQGMHPQKKKCKVW